jgi:hypothetical protein
MNLELVLPGPNAAPHAHPLRKYNLPILLVLSS